MDRSSAELGLGEKSRPCPYWAELKGRPQAQIEMRCVLKIVEKEWFEKLYMDETRNSRVRFVLTDKASEKTKKVASQH